VAAIHVTRKVDVGRWPALFVALGSPDTWLGAALDSGRVRLAASCLLLVQHASGAHAAASAAFRLLDPALSRDEIEVCAGPCCGSGSESDCPPPTVGR
jgi:hypothetical protein